MTGRTSTGGTIVDYSRFNHSTSPNGSNFLQSKFGGDTMSSHTRAGLATNGLDFGTGDFTIEFWYYPFENIAFSETIEYAPTQLYSYDVSLANLGNSKTLSNGVATWDICHTAEGFIRAYWATSVSAATGTTLTSTTGVQFAQWMHIAWVKQGLQSRLYINGVLEASLTAPAHVYTGGTDRNYTTARFGPKNSNLGYVDDVWVYNLAKYTSGFTPDVSPRPRGYGVTTHALAAAMVTTSVMTAGATDLLADNYFANVIMLINGENGVMQDVSSRNRQITKVGSPALTGNSKYGTSSIDFNVKGNYFTLPNADMTMGSGDWTAECWVYWISPGATSEYEGIFQIGDGTNFNASQLSVSVAILNPLGRLIVQSNLGTVNNAAYNFTQGLWTHVAVVRYGDNFSIYLAGALVQTFNAPGYSFPAPGTNSYLGRSPYVAATVDSAFCLIDEFRITKGVARYTGAFTPPLQAFDVVDYKGLVPVRNYVAADAVAVSSVRSAILSRLATEADLHSIMECRATLSPGMKAGPSISANAAVSPNIRWAYLGNSDGTAQKTLAAAIVSVASIPAPRNILKGQNFAANALAVASAPSTLSTVDQYDPFFTDVLLLLHGDGTNGGTVVTDNSLNAWTPTLVGAVNTSTAQSKFGGSSLLFNGTTSGLTLPFNSAFDISNSDVTVEFWFYYTAAPTQFPFIVLETPGATGQLFKLFYNADAIAGGQVILLISNSAATTTAKMSLPIGTGTWIHLMAMREGNLYSLWLNGVRKMVQYQPPGSSSFSTQVLKIGMGDTSFTDFFAGHLDDIRITKAARMSTYGPSFPVPSVPYPDVKRNWKLYVPAQTGCTATVTANLDAQTGASYKFLAATAQNVATLTPGILLNVKLSASVQSIALGIEDLTLSKPLTSAPQAVHTGIATLTVVGGGGTVTMAANAVMVATVTANLSNQTSKNLAADAALAPLFSPVMRLNKRLASQIGMGAVASISATIQSRGEDPYLSSVSFLMLFDDGLNSTAFLDDSPRPKPTRLIHSASERTVSPSLPFSPNYYLYDSSAGQTSSNYKAVEAYFPSAGGGNVDDMEFGSGDFTIEMWVYHGSSHNVKSMTLSYGDTTFLGSGSTIAFLYLGNDDQYYVELQTTAMTFSIPMGYMPTAKWTHLAVCREGHKLHLFVGGIPRTLGAFPFGQTIRPRPTGYEMALGMLTGRSNYYNLADGRIGYGDVVIGQIRITKGVARYTVPFTPLKQVFPTIQGANVKDVRLSNDGGDIAFEQVLFTFIGGPDGVVDYRGRSLTTPYTTLITATTVPGAGVFGGYAIAGQVGAIVGGNFNISRPGTFEAWVNTSAMPNGGGLVFSLLVITTFDYATATTYDMHAVLFKEASGDVTFSSTYRDLSITGVFSTSYTPSANGWDHIAICFDDAEQYEDANVWVYVNGILKTTGVNPVQAFPYTNRFYVGDSDGYVLLDQVRITSEYARYKGSNFTPPTIPYQPIRVVPTNLNIAKLTAPLGLVVNLSAGTQAVSSGTSAVSLTKPQSAAILCVAAGVAHLAINGVGALKALSANAASVATTTSLFSKAVPLASVVASQATVSATLAKWLIANVVASPTLTANLLAGTGTMLTVNMVASPSLIQYPASPQNLSDPYLSNVVLHLHGEGVVNGGIVGDSSPNPKKFTAVQAGYITTNTSYRYGTSSLYVNQGSGATNYRASTPPNTDFDFADGDFTIEFWIRVTSMSSGFFGGIFGRWGNPLSVYDYDYPNGKGEDLFIGLRSNLNGGGVQLGNIGLAVLANGLSFVNGVGSPDFSQWPLDKWTHVAMVREGSRYTEYINGTPTVWKTVSGALTYTPTQEVLIWPTYATGFGWSFWTGWLDELRITKGVARYRDPFWLSSTPFYSPQRLAINLVAGPQMVSAELILDPYLPRLLAAPAAIATGVATLNVVPTGTTGVNIFAQATLAHNLLIGVRLSAAAASVAKVRANIMGAFADLSADPSTVATLSPGLGYVQSLAAALVVQPVAAFSFPGPKPLAANMQAVAISTSTIGALPDTDKTLAAAMTARAAMGPNLLVPDRFPKLSNASYETNVSLAAPAFYFRMNDAGSVADNRMSATNGVFSSQVVNHTTGGPAQGGYASFDATLSEPQLDTAQNQDPSTFAMEVWIRAGETQPDDPTGAGAHIFGKRQVYQLNNMYAPVALTIYGGKIALLTSDGSNPYWSLFEMTDSVPLLWRHIVINVVSGVRIGMYLDGQPVVTYTAQPINAQAALTWTIGGPTNRLNGAGISTFNGDIAEAALYSRELTPAEIEQHYVSATFPTQGAVASVVATLSSEDGPGYAHPAADVKAQATLSGALARTLQISNCDGDTYWDRVALMVTFEDFTGSYINDASPTPKGLYDLSGVQVTDYYRFGFTSMKFPIASYSQLRINNHPDFNFGANDFCVDMWAHVTGTGPNGGVMFGRLATPVISCDLALLVDASKRMYLNVNNTTIISASSATYLPSSWVHVALVRYGTSFKIYINGTAVASATSSVTINSTSLTQLHVGSYGSDIDSWLTGWFDEIRVTKAARFYYDFVPSSEQAGRAVTMLCTAQATLTADLFVPAHHLLAAAPVGRARLDQPFLMSKVLASAGSAVATLNPGLRNYYPLVSNPSVVATATLNTWTQATRLSANIALLPFLPDLSLTVRQQLSVSMTSVAALTAPLGRAFNFDGPMVALTFVSASVSLKKPLAATPQGQATLAIGIWYENAISVTMVSTATVVAALSSSRALSANIVAAATATANLPQGTLLSANMQAVATMLQANIPSAITLSANAVATPDVIANLTREGDAQWLVQSTLTGTMRLGVHLSAAIKSVATTTTITPTTLLADSWALSAVTATLAIGKAMAAAAQTEETATASVQLTKDLSVEAASSVQLTAINGPYLDITIAADASAYVTLSSVFQPFLKARVFRSSVAHTSPALTGTLPVAEHTQEVNELIVLEKAK